MYLGNSPFVVIFFTLGALWPIGEPDEEEGETEEPEVCAPKQFEFDCTCTWLEEGGALILDEDKAQGYFPSILVFPCFFLSYSILVFHFPYPGFCLCFKTNWSSSFLSGFVSTVMS